MPGNQVNLFETSQFLFIVFLVNNRQLVTSNNANIYTVGNKYGTVHGE